MLFKACPALTYMIILLRSRSLTVPSRMRRNNICTALAAAHTLNEYVICGDASSKSTYERILKSGATTSTGLELADALITDPPYCLLERRRKNGDLRDPKARKKKLDDHPTTRRFENLKEYRIFTKNWLSIAAANVKDNGIVIIWTNTLGKAPILEYCTKELHCNFLGEYLWAKRTTTGIPSPTSTKNEISLRIYETALIFRKTSSQNSLKIEPKKVEDPSLPWSCITGYHEENETFPHPHPCHKPFAALEPLLRTWTRPGDVVLDCFAGSGGILASAARLGRKVKGIELLSEWTTQANMAISQAVIETKES